MNLVLLISLSVAILLAVMEFLSNTRRMWVRFVYCILSITAISSVYMVCKEDAGRMHKIKSDAVNSRQLLEKTENLISTQSAILSGELERINHAIENDKFTDSGMHRSLSRLQHHIQVLKKSSLKLNGELIEGNFSNDLDSLASDSEKSSDDAESTVPDSGILSEGNN